MREAIQISEKLIVAVSQYKTVQYTKTLLETLAIDKICFSILIVFDGTPLLDRNVLKDNWDISIQLEEQVKSIPELFNLMFGAAKLTGAKYMLWTGSDMIFRKGSLLSMYNLIQKGWDIVSPVKIDKDQGLFEQYEPTFDMPVPIIGFNDSTAMFRLDKMPFYPFEPVYGPYQFEVSALGFKLWQMGLKSVVDPNAVALHFYNKDVEHTPEMQADSVNWDKKRDHFLAINGEAGKWYCENAIMDDSWVPIFGFPCYVGPKAEE